MTRLKYVLYSPNCILPITTFYLHQKSLHSNKYYQRYSTFYISTLVALFNTRKRLYKQAEATRTKPTQTPAPLGSCRWGTALARPVFMIRAHCVSIFTILTEK